jgi:putative transcriptional regulator
MIKFYLDVLLKAQRLKPLQFVKISGANKTSVYNMYHNKPGTSVTTDTLNKICNVLECDLHDLVEYTPDKE